MAITRAQILEMGFIPAKRQKGLGTRKYDTLMYKINDTDYLYLGYHAFRGNVDYKTLWKSAEIEGDRVSYPIDSIGNISYNSLKDYIDGLKRLELHKAELAIQLEEDGRYSE